MLKVMNKEQFIEDSIKVHGDRYDYSKVEWEGRSKKVCIICKEHGEFWQLPTSHLKGRNCKSCANKEIALNHSLKLQRDFVDNCTKVHNGYYDYSLTHYTTCNTSVNIKCPKHGIFKQTPYVHLSGCGCPQCGRETNALKQSQECRDNFIQKAKAIHGDKYDYSLVNYINNTTNISIICPIHGVFYQTPKTHLNGGECRKCSYEKRQLAIIEKHGKLFKDKANIVHDNKYDYSLVQYSGNEEQVDIVCSVHGVFKQTPHDHLSGCGCPQCKKSLLENEITIALKENDITYEQQKRFNWLGLQRLDFYLPDYNIAIECQGGQHFRSVEYFGGEEEFKKRQELDERKYNLCKDNNVRILYYSTEKHLPKSYFDTIYRDKDILLKEIYNYDNKQRSKTSI